MKGNDDNREKAKEQEPQVVNKPLAQPPVPEPVSQAPDETPLTEPAKQEKPVFKIQILVTSRKLRPTDEHFKQLDPVEWFEENGLNKYTYGASADYNEIRQLRKQILDKFPEAFIIAFKNGEKVNVNSAIQEFKQKR